MEHREDLNRPPVEPADSISAGAVRPGWKWGHLIGFFLFIILFNWIFSYEEPALYSRLVYEYGMPISPVAEFTLVSLVQFLVMMAGLLLLAWIGGVGLNEMGFRRLSFKKWAIWGGLGGLTAFAAMIGISMIVQYFQPHLEPQPFQTVLSESAGLGEKVLLLLLGAVIMPLWEETYFRGMVYPVLRRYVGVAGGLVLAGLFFGAVHADWVRLVPLSLGGVILAYLYEKTDSLYPAWLAHGLWNGFMAFTVLL
ncbi:MAG: lysostaphin resistance A-like protein [Solirubrobacterales bacterium]